MISPRALTDQNGVDAGWKFAQIKIHLRQIVTLLQADQGKVLVPDDK
jgi:hypothetical protein